MNEKIKERIKEKFKIFLSSRSDLTEQEKIKFFLIFVNFLVKDDSKGGEKDE